MLLDITDQGVGMGAEEMAHANWRLDNPPVVDVAVSRRMGLFVVARLAARHGIRVRLRPAPAGGLTALVWLPDEVVSHEAIAGAPGLRRFDVGRPAPARLPSAADGAGRPRLAAQSRRQRRAQTARRRPPSRRSTPPARPGSPRNAGAGRRRRRGLGRAGCRAPACTLATPRWARRARPTSPLPAVGSEAAEADLAAQAERPMPVGLVPGR